MKIDARMTTHRVARCLDISTGSIYKISKNKIRVSRIAAKWIPHSLLEGQKRGRVSIARKTLKKYTQFNQRTFSNIWTVDEIKVTSTSPPENVATKYRQPKM